MTRRAVSFVQWALTASLASGCHRSASRDDPPPLPPVTPADGNTIDGRVERIDRRDHRFVPSASPCIDCDVRAVFVPAELATAPLVQDRVYRTDRYGRYRANHLEGEGSLRFIAVSADGWFGMNPNGLMSRVVVNNGGIVVSGTVRDAQSGAPVAGAFVHIGRAEATRDVEAYSPACHTNADGTYRLGGIVPIVHAGDSEEVIGVAANAPGLAARAEIRATAMAEGELRSVTQDLVLAPLP